MSEHVVPVMSVEFKTNINDKPYICLGFSDEREQYYWRGYLTPAAKKYTAETLKKVFGVTKADEVAELIGERCKITVEQRLEGGRVYNDVKYLNPLVTPATDAKAHRDALASGFSELGSDKKEVYSPPLAKLDDSDDDVPF